MIRWQSVRLYDTEVSVDSVIDYMAWGNYTKDRKTRNKVKRAQIKMRKGFQ